MKKLSIILMLLCVHGFAYANYAKINIIVPDAKIRTVASDNMPDKMHGNVVATFIEEYEIQTDVPGAYPMVTATIGYSDFLITIDSEIKPNTPEYARVYEHEQEHIKIYQSISDDFHDTIVNTIGRVVAGVVPTEPSRFAQMVELALEFAPEMILLRQKISAEQEIRNKGFDREYKRSGMLKITE